MSQIYPNEKYVGLTLTLSLTKPLLKGNNSRLITHFFHWMCGTDYGDFLTKHKEIRQAYTFEKNEKKSEEMRKAILKELGLGVKTRFLTEKLRGRQVEMHLIL